MPKIIKYNQYAKINYGTNENPEWKEIFSQVEMTWSKSNEEVAKLEAYNGEYEIIDDGEPEIDTATTDDVLNTLLGVTE